MVDKARLATNWQVVTGGPSSGKTTTVNLLRERGYTITIEHARHYLDLQRIEGHSVAEVRSRQLEFQLGVLTMQLAEEASLDPQRLVFLDRAIPDSLAYYRFLGLEPAPVLLEALQRVSYRTVFLLDLLPLAPDYARTEDPAAQHRIHSLLAEVYRDLGFPVVEVPVLSPRERVDFILERVSAQSAMKVS
ncbi:MAG: ATP-binding protein [Microbacterium ginsengisoli]|nr:ATP-binding protein [Microbacterium ginsengisoli]